MTEPTKIAITGATGLIGSRLAAFWDSQGHQVCRLVRHNTGNAHEIQWNPGHAPLDPALLDGVEVVVNLAGESIAARWTDQKKAAILDSRLQSTATLCHALTQLKPLPKVLISASAVGYYGPTPGPANETAPAGRTFLSDVCRQWEEAAEPARQAGIRVVHPRMAVVLSRAGGALPAMIKPFKLGIGGRVGNGLQFISWIHREDLVRAMDHLAFYSALAGAVNVAAPNPVRQGEFAKLLGKIVHRSAVVPLPAAVVRTMFGQMGQELLLDSCEAFPERLQQDGFTFLYPRLESALRQELETDG